MIVSEAIAIQFMEQMIPVHRFLGVKVLEIRDGYCKMLFPFREEVLGNFRARRWHGGIIATALDSVGGAVASTTLTSMEDKLATIDMRVDYIRGTSPTDLIVKGVLVRSGNRIIATDMEAWQENEQKLVATGRAMYSVFRQQGEVPASPFEL
ncbi:MAG: hotdog fold thioesterase [Bacteroidia bacterium]|nr:hotdog fold thioesterase [Bacteroidia bacterium]